MGERSGGSSGSSEEEEEVKRTSFTRGHWRPAEDETLRRLVHQCGPQNWNAIAEHFQGRSGKSCRLRWFNQLDPRIDKRPFSEEEEERLLAAHRLHGNKWAFLARLFPGRTDNAVKNHWHVIMARRKRNESVMSSSLLSVNSLQGRSGKQLPVTGFANHAGGYFDYRKEINSIGNPRRIDRGFSWNFAPTASAITNASVTKDNSREYIDGRGNPNPREHFFSSYGGITNFGDTFGYSKIKDADSGMSNMNTLQQRQEFRSFEQDGVRPFIDFMGVGTRC